MSEKNDNSIKAVGYVMIITLVGKILGLLRDRLMYMNYDIGLEANAFFTASRIPRVFFDAVFASAISASFIPIFNDVLTKKNKEEAFSFSNDIINIFGLFTIILTVIGMFFSLELTYLFADGFDYETASLASNIMKILFPTIFFTGIAFCFVGILQSLNIFNITAAISIFSNGIIIIYYIFLNETFGIYGLAVAFLIGWSSQVIVQIPYLIKCGFKYKFKMNFKDENVKKVFKLMLPVMVSTWVQPVNILINTRFASNLFSGSGVSAIEYANNLYSIIVGVVVLSVANVIFPELSKLTASNKEAEFTKTVSSTIKSLMLIVIPMMVGIMCLSTELTVFALGGERDSFASELTSYALMFFSLGMPSFALNIILSRAFFAENNGKTPLIASIFSIFANLIFCYLLVDNMHVGGLALASSVSTCVNSLFLLIPMTKKYKDLIDTKFMKDIFKMLLCAVIMGIIVIIARNYLLSLFSDESFIIAAMLLLIPTLLGVIIYFVLAYLLKLEEVYYIINILKKRRS